MEPPKKRKTSPKLVSNPFIKRRNMKWRVSPPPFRDPERPRRRHEADGLNGEMQEPNSRWGPAAAAAATDTAATSDAAETRQQRPRGRAGGPSGSSSSSLVENNTIKIEDHLSYFADLLAARTLNPYPAGHPLLPMPTYGSLYRRNLGSPRGAHFVVTQHDHPVAGPHYDLRLQINESSSCSWAVMYGLPGDPNSRGRWSSSSSGGRAGAGVLRNATETRVHCLWNHLVETAGAQTGSMMVWDSGEYEVLPPRRGVKEAALLVDSQEMGPGGGGDDDDDDDDWWDGMMTQQEKLASSFAARKIRLRLNGTRLPRGYAVNLRLTRDEDAAGRARANGPRRGRRRGGAQQAGAARRGPETSSDSDDEGRDGRVRREEEGGHGGGSSMTARAAGGVEEREEREERERELRGLEDEQVRRTNAYPGAVNTIGSVHQRKWFLSLDREACGFERIRKDGKVWWERAKGGGVDEEDGNGGGKNIENNRYGWPFYVRGPDHERSIVTGRLGADILKDEGVVGFVRRKGWRPILH